MAKKIRHEMALTGEKEYRASLKGIGEQLKGVTAQQALLNAQYGKGDQSLAKLTQAQEQLSKKLSLQRQRMEQIQKRLQQVTQAEGANSQKAQQLARDYAYAQKDVYQTEQALEALNKSLAQASRRTEQLKSKLKALGVTTPSVAKAFETLGSKMTKALTLPLAGAAVAAGKMSLDYGDSLASLYTIADRSQVSMEDMGDALLSASDRVNMGAKEMSEAAYEAISAGASTAQAAGFVETSAKAAKAGMTDVSTAVDGATSAMNAWKIAYSDADLVYGKMIIAQNEGKVTLGEIAGQIGQITGLAPQLNVSLDETLSAVAALTKNGVQSSSAINGLKNVMNGILKPTTEAQKTARKLGIDFSAAGLKAKGLTGFLGDLYTKTKGNEATLAKLFGSVEGLSAVMQLGTTAAADYASVLAQMGNSAGVLDKAFEQRTASRAEQLSKSVNQLKNSAIRLGDSFGPAIDVVNGGLSAAAGYLGSLNGEQMKALTNVALGVAALGPLNMLIGKTTNGLDKAGKALQKFGVNLSGGKLAIIAAGFMGVATAVALVHNHLESLRGVNKLKAAFEGVTVDTNKVQEAVDKAAEVTTYDFKVLANAQMDFESGSEPMDTQLEKYLKKGKTMNKSQQKKYKKLAEEWLAPITDGIAEGYTAKKASLDAALAAGIMNPEEYATQLEELTTQTENTKAALTAEKDAYVAYALELATSSKEPAREQLAQLEALKQKVIETGNAILEANSQAISATKTSYLLVKEGRGDNTDLVQGTRYLQTQAAFDREQASNVYQTQRTNQGAELEQATLSGDQAAVDKVLAQMDADKAAYEAKVQEINQSYTQGVNDMFAGMLQRYPEQMELMRGILASQNIVEEITKVVADFGNDGESQAARDALNEKFKEIFGYDANHTAGAADALKSYVNDVKASMAANMENADFSEVFTAFSAAISGGLLDGLDVEGLSTDMQALLTNFDLKDDGKTWTEQMLAGEIEGVQGGQQGVNDAILVHAQSLNDTFTSAQGIQSPSTVWRGFGGQLMTGLGLGIQRGLPGVLRRLRRLSPALKLIGRQSVQGMINGVNSRRAALISAYASMARAAAEAARRELKISSPSKVFFDIGGYTVEGMMIGLDSKVQALKASMSQTVAQGTAAARARVPASQQAQLPQVSSPSQPVQVIFHYNGPATSREARKMSQMLGGYMADNNLGKGMKG